MQSTPDKSHFIAYLQELIDSAPVAAVDAQNQKFITWKNRAAATIGGIFGENSDALKSFRSINWHTSTMVWDTGNGNHAQSLLTHAKLEQEAMERGFAAAKGQLAGLITSKKMMHEDPQAQIENSLTKRVFVVHGHDGALKNAVSLYLSKLGLNPIVLHEQVDKGRTVIEKFEQESQCDFAIILATADDLAASAKAYKKADPTSPDDVLKARARQNVVFELGYFVGRMGRGRVAIIVDSGIELPSDLAGVVYKQRSTWTSELWPELDALGYGFTGKQIQAASAIRE